MIPAAETILTNIPASDEGQRIVVVLVNHPSSGSQIELREQSWADGIGWFTQGSLRLEPGQLPALRSALGGSGAAAMAKRSAADDSQGGVCAFPRLAQAETA